MFQVFVSTCDTLHEPIIADFTFEMDIGARTASASIDSVAEMRGAPISIRLQEPSIVSGSCNPMASSSSRPRSDAAFRRRWARSDLSSTTLPRTICRDPSLPERHGAPGAMTAIETLFKRDDAVVLAALVLLALLAWLATLGGPLCGYRLGPPMAHRFSCGVDDGGDDAATPRPWCSLCPACEGRGRRRPVDRHRGLHGYLAVGVFSVCSPCSSVWPRTHRRDVGHDEREPRLAGGLLDRDSSTSLHPQRPPASPMPRAAAPPPLARGPIGRFRMGVAHGAYCLGCCAVLMLLLFVGGVMNLVWIAGLTLLVAVEKLAPFGAVVARVTGE